jgi:hypothetical protein
MTTKYDLNGPSRLINHFNGRHVCALNSVLMLLTATAPSITKAPDGVHYGKVTRVISGIGANHRLLLSNSLSKEATLYGLVLMTGDARKFLYQ